MQLTSHALFTVSFILSVLISVHTGPVQAADFNPLKGQWRFQQGNDPQWADPAYPDQQWTPVKIGLSLQSQGVFDQSSIGWYRVRFNPSKWLTSNRSASGYPYILDVLWKLMKFF